MALAALEVAGGAIVCPQCNCRDFRTYKTIQGVAATFRYKACRHCGHKVLTTSQTNERMVRDVSADSSVDFENNDL